jgi:hypothetical protein
MTYSGGNYGPGQPDAPSGLAAVMHEMTAVEAGGLGPSVIINQPNTFTLHTSFTIEGQAAPLLNGEVFDVQHHFQRLEDGLAFRLNGNPVTAVFAGGQIVMPYTSPPFTTGPTGSGAQLEIPTGETEGTFRVLTQLVGRNANIRGIVAAFQDGLLLHVI